MRQRKPCRKCGGEKAPGRGKGYCEACDPMTPYEAAKRYAEKNPEKVREAQRQGNGRRRASMKHFLDGVKLGSGCVDCGYADDVRALQFDHIQPKKQHVSEAGSISACLPELGKCEVRCANCHAIITAKRRDEE